MVSGSEANSLGAKDMRSTSKGLYKATPLIVEVAIWYYCRTEDFPNLAHMPSVRDIIDRFVRFGFLTDQQTATSGRFPPPRFRATDGLRTYVDALCAVPFPVKIERWELPQ